MQQNKQEQIRDFLNTRTGRITLLLIPIFIIIIVVVIITKSNSAEQSKIKIDNFSEVLPNVPSYQHEAIEEKLFKKVEEDVPEGTKIPTNGAKIDAESVYTFSLPTTFNYVDFKISIESLNLTYIARCNYGTLEGSTENEGEVSTYLYDIDDKTFSHPDPITYLLPQNFSSERYSLSYTVSIDTKSGYSIIATLDPGESVYLEGKLGEFKANAETQIEEYIQNCGLNPEDYDIIYKYKVIR